jgi:type I restriction enzyme S subunit
MAGEWRTRCLGELAELHRQQVNPAESPGQLFQYFSLPAFDERQVPAVELGSAIGSQKFTVPPAAILVSKLNPRIPRVWEPELRTDCSAVASTEFLVLLPRQGTDRRFLKYVCLSPAFRSEMEARATGTSGSHQRVQPQDALAIELDVPASGSEQRAIAHILGTLDDKIELLRRMNETLEAMARAIFKAWFVNFEPVRAKTEGRWQHSQSLPSLPAHLYDLFPNRLVDSELGEIPEGWVVATLADFAMLNPETWAKDTAPNQIEYVDLANTKWGRIESTIMYLWEDAPSRAQRVLRAGDTIVGTVRPANGSYALISEEGLTASTGFAVLRPREPDLREVVYLAATASDNIDTLAHLADGAAYPAVRPEVVADTRVVKSPHAVIERFSNTVRPLLDKIAANDLESRTLAALRDALLPKLISGDIRIEHPERIVAGEMP